MTQDVYTRKVVFSKDMPNGEVYYYEEEFHMDSATLTERSLGDRLVGVSTKGSSDIIAIRNYQGVPKGGLLKLVPIGNNQKGYKLVDALSNLYDGLDSKAQPKEVTTAKDAPSANDMPRNNAIEHKGKSWVENEEELLESDLNDGMRPWYYDEDELPSDDADFGATAIYRSNRNSPLGADTRGGAHFYHALSNNNSDTLDYSEDNNSLLKASLRGNGLMNGAQHNNNQAQAMVANANNNSTKRTSQSTNSYGFGRFQRTTLQSEPAFKDFYTPKDTSNTSFVTARQLNLGPTKFKTVPASAYAAQANKDRNVAHNYHESNTRISSYVQDGYSFDNTRKEPQIPQAAFSHNPAEKKVQTVSEQKTKFSEQVFQERMENSSLAHLKLPKATTRLAQDENYEPSESAQIFADHYAPYHQAFSHNNSVGPYSYGTEFAAQEHDMLEQTRAYKKLQAQKASAQNKAEPKEDVVLAEFKKAPSKANEKQWWRDRSLTERSAQKAFAMDSFKQTKQGSFIGTPEQYLPKAPEETYNQRVIVTNNYSVDQLKGSASTVISSNASVNGESSVIKDAVYEPVVDQVVEPVVEQVPEQLKEQFKSNSSNQAKEVKEAHISEVYEEPTPAQDPAQVTKSQESKPEIKSESAKEQETVSEASASDSLSDNAKSTDDLESTAALKKDVSTKFTGQGAALANAIVSQGGDEEDQSVEDEGGHTNIERNDIKLSPVDKSFVNFKTADGSITEPMEESSFASEDKAPEPGFAVNSSDGTAITTNSKELKHEVEQRDLTANKQEVVATNISSTNNDSDDNTDATITTQGSSNTSFAFGDFKTANGTQANVYYRVPVVSQKQLQAQKEQEEKARQEAERLAILKAEQERIAAEKKAEEERLAAEKAEQERLEAERIAAEEQAQDAMVKELEAEQARLEAEKEAEQKVQDQLKAERQQQAQQDQSAKSAQQEKAQDNKATTAAAATEVASNKPMTKSQARRAKQKAKAQARAAAAAAAAATTGATTAANATTPAANASTTSQTQESSKSATIQKVADTKDSLNEQTATAQKEDKDTQVEIQPSPALSENTILAEESTRSMATNLLGSNDSYFNSTDTNSSFDHQVVISAEYTHHGLEEPIENQSSTTVKQENNILDSISPAYKPADDKTAALLSQSNNIEHGKQEPALSTVPVLESDDDYIQEPQLDLQNSKLESFDKEPELNNVSEVENIQDKEEPSFSANEQLGTIIETVNVEEMADKDLIFATPTRFADNDNTANGEQVNSLSESVFMSETSVNNKEEHLKDQSAQDSLANFKPMSNEIAASNKQSQAEHDPARAVQAAVADVVEDSLVTDELLGDAFMSDESNLEYMHTTSSHDKGKNKGSNSLANLAAELIDDFDDPFEDDFAQSLNDESKK